MCVVLRCWFVVICYTAQMTHTWGDRCLSSLQTKAPALQALTPGSDKDRNRGSRQGVRDPGGRGQ